MVLLTDDDNRTDGRKAIYSELLSVYRKMFVRTSDPIIMFKSAFCQHSRIPPYEILPLGLQRNVKKRKVFC